MNYYPKTQVCIHITIKKQIPVCNIMGVNIAAIDMKWLLDFTIKNIKQLSGNYMCVSNVHTTVMAYKDETYRSIQNGGIMAIPDGGPLSSIGRKRGHTNMQRIPGPSYMEKIFELGLKEGYSHYFYGSTEETLKKLKHILEKQYPGIKIVGMYSPPFRCMTDIEDDQIIKVINEAKADFVWISLGAPKQEKWMKKHQYNINGFMIGIGAGFDYLAGNIKRAPQWMQVNSLEWVYRLLQEPRRLFLRYWNTNWKFIWHAYIKGE